MKNSFVKITLIIAMSLLSFGSSAADTVAIYIDGRVISSPCTTINGGETSARIPLGDDIGAMSMQSAGSNSEWVDFYINVWGCPAGTNNVTVTFSGTPDTDDGTRWLNTASNKARNTSVELRDAQTNNLLSNGSVLNQSVVSGGARLQLKTSAYSKYGSVTPGDISTVVVATFTYQ